MVPTPYQDWRLGPIVFLFLASFAFHCNAQTSLMPGETIFAVPDFLFDKQVATRKALSAELSDYPLMRLIYSSSSNPSRSISIDEKDGKFFVIFSWANLSKDYVGGDDSTVHTSKAEIDKDVAKKINLLWVEEIKAARYPKKNNEGTGGGSKSVFYLAFEDGFGTVSAVLSAYDARSNSKQLVQFKATSVDVMTQIGDDLILYCTSKPGPKQDEWLKSLNAHLSDAMQMFDDETKKGEPTAPTPIPSPASTSPPAAPPTSPAQGK